MGKTYHAVGLMSGSSLDGLDVGYCRFEVSAPFQILSWQLLKADCLPFSPAWEKRLQETPLLGGAALAEASTAFGHYQGQLVNGFFEENNISPANIDLIASHGHTVFHEPSKGFTVQIGDGASLAALTGCTVVCDFRSSDIALGGQGAPLAPMADKMLYPGYDFYLNLGGIANLTCNAFGNFIAFDITGANQVLNALVNDIGLPFDENGGLATSGQLDERLFAQLNSFPFFKQPYPKSLSNQWVQGNPVKTCRESTGAIPDKLHTVCRHVAFQLEQTIKEVVEKEGFKKEKYRMLATGGGVFNGFLMKCIREECTQATVLVPEINMIKFKEACLMALLGVMRLEGVPNCMSSVTGAERDTIGGAVYHGQL